MSAQDSNVEEYGILAADGDPERQESRYGRQIQSAGYAGNQICERTVLKMYDVHVCSTFKKGMIFCTHSQRIHTCMTKKIPI